MVTSNNEQSYDPLLREAIDAIDSGDLELLKKIVTTHPQLVSHRLAIESPGYFDRPYLLWFIAGNPIRRDQLPANIVGITGFLIGQVKANAPGTSQEQLDYTLGLVASGRVVRDCGVQIPLMKLLISEGAKPGPVMTALAHHNKEAADLLINAGSRLSLAAAICLDRSADIEWLADQATPEDLQLALTAAAFYGNTAMIRYLLAKGADPNAYLDKPEGFHAHATALHQAIQSGSLEAVKTLLQAGALPELKDRVYEGTALDWAWHLQRAEEYDEEAKKRFKEIFDYLSVPGNYSNS